MTEITKDQLAKKFPHFQQHEEYPHLKDLSGKMALMLSPAKFTLTVHHGETIDFLPGMNQVPVELAKHPYLAANGVKLASEATAQETAAAGQVNPKREEAINFLMVIGGPEGQQFSREAATAIVDEHGTKDILSEKAYREKKAHEDFAAAQKAKLQPKSNIATGLGFEE